MTRQPLTPLCAKLTSPQFNLRFSTISRFNALPEPLCRFLGIPKTATNRPQDMSVLEELRAMQTAQLVDDDEPMEVEYQPGLSDFEIDEIEREVGAKLPADYRDLLRACAGIGCSYLEVDFTGETMDFGMEEMRPHSIPIASDGCGNFYVAEFGAGGTNVFFWCHDPPAVCFQCTGMAAWLRELRTACGPDPESSELHKVMEIATFEVFKNPNHPLTRESMLASSDPDLRAFAETLEGDDWEAADLRNPKLGEGFAWARYGPDAEVRRAPTARIFATRKPAPKKGLFSFLKRGA